MDISSFNNKIIIIHDRLKTSLLELLSGKLINTKIITLSELKRNYYFDYDKKTIYYVSKKYDYVYDIAKSLVENLYYVNDVIDEKTKFLSELKLDLDNNGLLYKNELYKSFFKNKNVIVLGLKYIDKFYKNIFNELSEICNIEYMDLYDNSSVKELYSFDSEEDEISFVCTKICNLIKQGIDINHIKLTNVSENYYFNIVKYFKMFNIPINIDSISSINGSKLVKLFIDNYNSDINKSIDIVKDNIKTIEDEYVYESIVKVINNYSFCDDYNSVKEFIFEDLRNIKTKSIKLDNAVNIIDFKYDYVSENDYVFLLGFNEGIIPANHMDDDYLSDKIKTKIGISTSYELNESDVNLIRNNIRSINHLVVSYITHDLNGEVFISSSYSEELFKKCIYQKEYNHSNSYNKSNLVIEMDDYNKYGSISDSLIVLNNNYKSFDYMSYSNRYTMIDNNEMYKYLGNKLSLSYTSMNSYYECAFKYYLSYVLKLNKYEDTFDTTIGNLFHKILSMCFSDEFDFESVWNSEIKNIKYDFSSSELFFLNNLKSELSESIEIIKKQMNYTLIKNIVCEKEVKIKINDKLNITFEGKIDKLMYDNVNGVNIVMIVDYKTGNSKIDINNSIYGLNLQLPIYMYLVLNSDIISNPRIGGLYLQNIVNTKNDVSKEESLKLNGYTNSDESILSIIDKNYENSSLIKNMKTTSNGLSSYAKILNDDEMMYLSNIVKNKINESSENILNSKFDINPKRIKNTNISCAYCKYKDICNVREEDIIDLPYKKLDFGGEENA